MTKRKQQHKTQQGRKTSSGRSAKPVVREEGIWLYGTHAINAALANPERRKKRLLVAGNAIEQIICADDDETPSVAVTRDEIEALLPADAVHQGLALEVKPLKSAELEDIFEVAAEDALIVVLDQASDPRNIGAVMRSASAFGAAALVLPDRHAPEATGVMAKAASGALDRLPLVRVTNISRALAMLKEAGFWCIGLDGRADTPLAEAGTGGRNALIIGSEGSGLRRLTAEKCDILASIPINAEAESLNLSAAAAIALYEMRRSRP
ncbi:MAG: 23S rRNA (guanosine(2251)-2'-O)-methyltransferase RlmB [Rhodospirillales bacterium]|nr:23S rRNA (guanosine(2251)-2'-O)-methyltransferase RlmB [Rhodospirillales bacterium]